MSRISERISQAVNTTRCPGCGERVVPVEIPAPETPADQERTAGQRWSFIWVPPSGESCPKCHFPLTRYARRRKWIRLLEVGIAVLTVAGLLAVAQILGDIGFLTTIMWIATVGGAMLFAVGVVGTIVGGRRT